MHTFLGKKKLVTFQNTLQKQTLYTEMLIRKQCQFIGCFLKSLRTSNDNTRLRYSVRTFNGIHFFPITHIEIHNWTTFQSGLLTDYSHTTYVECINFHI